MSGGHFDYQQFRIEDIANSIEGYLFGCELDESDIEGYINDFWEPPTDEEKAWIYKHQRTLPNLYEYSPETILEMKKGLEILRKAYIYAQRIDWLLSGDDGEDSFHRRLKKELSALNNTAPQ